jgi:hypothetical protein
MTVPVGRLAAVLLAAAVGALAGVLLLGPFLPPWPQTRVVTLPLPHHIPKHPGGLSLRLAMVHDVIHERYAKHGPAYYEHRNRLARAERDRLAREAAARPDGRPDPAYWTLTDDLAAGLAYLALAGKGDFAEATALEREKLAAQQRLGIAGRDLYGSYANLGTFLVIDGIVRGIKGDNAAAKALLAEGLPLIKKAVEVKPDAHFGREAWQILIVEFLLAAADRPELLLKYDMIGNRLDGAPSGYTAIDQRRTFETRGFGFPLRRLLQHERELSTPESLSAEEAGEVRGTCIAAVGAEDDWAKDVKSSRDKPAPFDEPTLGILGMWTLAAGANPHFAVALGEIMLRVGQSHIAWAAYERAVDTAPVFLPDAALREKFVALCRRRQELIEKSLPPGEAAELRPRHRAELAFGLEYQRKYQAYEAERIAAGVDIADPHFYDAFHAAEGSPATPSGPEEFVAIRKDPHYGGGFDIPLPAALLGAGPAALAAALWLRRRAAVDNPPQNRQ